MVLGLRCYILLCVFRRGGGDFLARGNVRNESSAGIGIGNKYSFGSSIWLLFAVMPSFTKEIFEISLSYFDVPIGKCTP